MSRIFTLLSLHKTKNPPPLNPISLSEPPIPRQYFDSLHHAECEEGYKAWSRRQPGAMSAPSGPRPLSRGEGRGRARDAPQARAGSEDESQNRNGLRPTRGGSMNNTQDRYAQRGRLTRGNWTTARNGRSPRNPRTTMNANPEHNIPQQYDPRTAAGRQGAGAVRRAVPSPSTNTPANANTPPKPRWRDPTKVPYAEYKDRMYELWTTVCVNHSFLLT